VRRSPGAGGGGTGERVVHEPRVPRGPATRHSRSECRARWGGCGEGTAPSPGQDPPRAPRDLTQAFTRDDDADGRAFSRLALDFAKSSQESDALAHSEQTEVPRAHASLSPLLRFEAMSIIADVNFQSLF